MGRIALLFPGQGAQSVGMGRDFAETFPVARRVFQVAGETLGWDVAARCFEGPEDELGRTAVSQPCLLTVSAAVLRAMEQEVPDLVKAAEAAAGLSLGEYTALVAAGAVGLEDALRLVERRGCLMEEACRRNPGRMASVLGLDADEVREICRATPGAIPANFNCPGQVVVSGDAHALERVAALARERGAKRVKPLKVAGAFHSPHMAAAREGLRRELEDVAFEAPRIPVIANVTAEPVEKPQQIRENLADQLTGSVLWQQSMERLIAEGFDTFYEVGPGKVLAGLLKRTGGGVPCVSVNSVAALETLRSAGRPARRAGAGAREDKGGH